MLKFKSISIRNFLSYGTVPTIIPLDRPGTTLVLGENLDATSSGVGSNGVGKTAVINALTYALYDAPISSISKDNLVNNINKKNMEVVVEFSKDDTDYCVKRVRKSKAGAEGNHTHLYKNGVDVTPDSSRNVNKEIERIIGMPYELFVRIITFSADLGAFFDLPTRSHYAANQTDIIEELFDLKILSEKAEILKKEISGTEKSLETNQNKIDQLKKEHERHNKQIESAKGRIDNWYVQNKKDIRDIQSKLKKIDNVDIEQQSILNRELKDLNSELREAIGKQQTIESNIKRSTAANEKRKKELEHLSNAKCPYCLQAFQSSKGDIEKIREQIQKSQNDIELLKVELENADSTIESLTARHKDIKPRITVSDFDELLEIKGKVEAYQLKLSELQQATNPHIETLKDLEKVEIEEIDMSTINTLKRKIDHQKFLLKVLTRKDSFVRKVLLDKNIPYLNERLAYYLTELGLPHTVEFSHEMTALISEFGKSMDFGNLSKGQRARVNIALSFAFRDVLQKASDFVNVCMLDEVLDTGLDEVGIQAVARMLKQKAREERISMFIISHRTEIDNAFDRKMIVQMSKRFSYIKHEDC